MKSILMFNRKFKTNVDENLKFAPNIINTHIQFWQKFQKSFTTFELNVELEKYCKYPVFWKVLCNTILKS